MGQLPGLRRHFGHWHDVHAAPQVLPLPAAAQPVLSSLNSCSEPTNPRRMLPSGVGLICLLLLVPCQICTCHHAIKGRCTGGYGECRIAAKPAAGCGGRQDGRPQAREGPSLSAGSFLSSGSVADPRRCGTKCMHQGFTGETSGCDVGLQAGLQPCLQVLQALKICKECGAVDYQIMLMSALAACCPALHL